jgi:formylglycine-generating enzyme required for sulfatase activity
MVNERVKLLQPLAGGAMGSVWRAYHDGLRTQVAVKFLADMGSASRKWAAKRFTMEASAAAQIHSPHVVRMLDHGVSSDGTPYIVMELLQGRSLDDYIKERGHLDLAETADIISQAAKALQAAHGLGVIHRDIKPSNIFLSEPHGELLVKVLDFGCAKQTRSPQQSSVTEPGMIVGSPGYMCRDTLIAKSSMADPMVDLWALAVVAYRCITGVLPFRGPEVQDVCAAIVRGTFARPSSLQPNLGPRVDAWFLRALAKEREKRFADARELSTSFAELAKTEGRPRRVGYRGQRLALGALGIVAIASVAVLTQRPPSRSAPLLSASTTATPSETAPPLASASTSPPLPAKPAPPAGPPPEAQRGEIFIPAGEVQLGCASNDDCADHEKGKRVSVDAFFLDQLEVTVLSYGKCVVARECTDHRVQLAKSDAKNPSNLCNWHQVRRESHPMNCVSFAQAESYCRWRGQRLPTEAEWVRAARGDSARVYPWGDDRGSCERAVMLDGEDGLGCGRGTSWPVKTNPGDVSPFGVRDMAGNLREWIQDWYDKDYLMAAPAQNPTGPERGTEHVLKGGSWTEGPAQLRIASRGGAKPSVRAIHVGFRCARSAKP